MLHLRQPPYAHNRAKPAKNKSLSLSLTHTVGLSPTTRANTLKELSLKREILGWLIAARSGHGHFAAYHERFGHEEETDLYCTCGQKRAQLHPFSCPNARAHRSLLWCKKTRRHLGPEEILGTPKGALIFAEWAPATGLFKRRN